MASTQSDSCSECGYRGCICPRCETCGCQGDANCVCPQIVAFLPGVQDYAEELQVEWQHRKLFIEPEGLGDVDVD